MKQDNHKFRSAYTQMIVDDIKSLSDVLAPNHESEFLESHLLIGEMMPISAFVATDSFRVSSRRVLDLFKREYLKINREVLGSNFNSPRNRALQPFTFAFVDVGPEARRSGVFTYASNAHVHFLMLLHPDVRDDFAELICPDQKADGLFRIHRPSREVAFMDFDWFSLDKGNGSLEGAAGYASTTASHPAFRSREGQAWEAFPNVIFDRLLDQLKAA